MKVPEIEPSDTNCPECGRPLFVPVVGGEGTKYCESCNVVFKEVKRVE